MDSPNNTNPNNPNPLSPLPGATPAPPSSPPPPPFAPPPTPSQTEASAWPGTSGWPSPPNPLPETTSNTWPSIPPTPAIEPAAVSTPEPIAPAPPFPSTPAETSNYPPIPPSTSPFDTPSTLPASAQPPTFTPSDSSNLPNNTVQLNSTLDSPWNTPTQPPPLENPQPSFPPPLSTPSSDATTPIFTQNPAEETAAPNTWTAPSPTTTPFPNTESSPQSYSVGTPSNLEPANTASTEPIPAAPTDFSHLISSNQPETPPPSFGEDTLVAPLPVPEIPTVPIGTNKGVPKWLIGLGVGLLIIVAGASAYFILGIGQPPKTTTSIPATQVSNPTVKAPPPIATPIAQPAATGSASFGQLQGNNAPPATSAADLLRRNQQQGR